MNLVSLLECVSPDRLIFFVVEADSNPEVAAFLDAIHSVTARVTSTLYICQQQASSIPTQFTIVGSEAVHLDKITDIQANQTIDIWLDRTTEFFQRPLRATLPDIWASTRPHGDHPETCPEASLMAGLFREEKLSARFSEVRTISTTWALIPDQVQPPDISVGLDRNACPSCVLLAESIYEVCSVRFRLPGRHYQFSPWVPPKGLPDNVLNLLELKLQAYLLDRHVESLGFYSYKASQPNLMDIPKYRIAIEKDIAGTLFDDSDSELSDPASDDDYPIDCEPELGVAMVDMLMVKQPSGDRISGGDNDALMKDAETEDSLMHDEDKDRTPAPERKLTKTQATIHVEELKRKCVDIETGEGRVYQMWKVISG